ncbi:MAG: PAS domain S-box protein [Rubrobacteraceae bacterium]
MRFRMRHADGSWRHVETVRNNLLDDPVVRGMVNVSRDVTEREEVLEALRGSQAEFRAIFDRSAAGMALVDAEGWLKESNPALQTMLGYGAEELQRMRFGDVTHPDDVAADMELFEKMMAGELDHFRLEKRYIRKDGSLIWGHLTSSIIRGDEERPRLMVGMVEDITERKRAEEKLQASEAELKALFEAMYDIVLVLDRDGRCLKVASANPSLLYMPAQEQTGKTLHEILPSDKADLLLSHLRHALDTGRTVSVEYSLTIEDRERWFSANVSPISGDRVAWVAHDATGWKEMEAALRESEERYRAVMEQSVESIYLYDANTRQVLESNAAFQEMVGYTAEELRGMRIYDFIAHEPEDIDRNVERSLREKRRHIGERTYRRKDSTSIIVDTSATVISHGGRTALCAVSRDVTERKRLEDALREREEHFRALIQNAPDTITILDADATIRYDSPSIERVLGYEPGERFGGNGFDYVHPADLERARRTFAEVLDNPAVGRPVEYRLRHKDGSWRHFEAIRTNLLDNPAVSGIVLNYRDVTERRQAEDDLRESEERHRRLVEDSPETIAILSEGKIAFINAAGAKLAGAEGPERLIGEPFLDFVHPDFREAVKRRVELALEGETTALMQQKLLRTDGSIIEVEAVTIPTIYEGKPAVQSIIRDITERKAAEDALRASEEQFRGAFENASTGMALVGLERRFLQVNRALCEMLGYPEELLSRRTPEITHPDDLEASRERAERILSGVSENQSLEKRYVHADGHTVWVVSDVAVVRDSEGNPSHFVSLFLDVTERKQAEEALRVSEERFRSVVQNSSEIIKIVGLDGTLRYASPAFERLLGYDPSEAVGMNVLDYVHPEDLPHVLEETEKALDTPGTARNAAEYRFRHKDGSWRWIESSGTYLLDEPGIEGVLINERDITGRKTREARLRLLESVAVNANDAIMISEAWPFDEPGPRVVYVNETFTRMTGYEPDEVIGKTPRLLQGPGTDRAQLDRIRESFERWEPVRAEVLNFRKDGTEFWVELNITPVADESGLVTHWVSVQRETTERRRMEEALRESEERYRAVVEQSVENIYLFDPRTKRILESNAALEELLGYTSVELHGMTIYDIVAHPAEDIDLTVERHLLEGQRFVGERRYRHKDGSLIEVGVSATVIPYRDGHAVCAVARDATEQKALEEQLTHQAFHDPLTDLPNRALFLDRLDHALSRVRREDGSVAVLFVDLDDFKSINDSLGHEAGDILLGEVARRLQSCVRPGDTVARLFGDEFGVMLDAPAEVEEARQVTERITEILRAPFHLDGREVFVSSSIGIASGPVSEDPEREQPKDVLRRADLAMYAAKSSGKSRYEVFNPSMNTRAVQRMELKTQLTRGVEHNEFEVHYQPIIEAETGGISGLEALVRWRHPERGLVAAEEFIELAEDTGLIHPIGEVVFEQVCRQTQRWREDGLAPPFLISVNFSASQFADQADTISRVLGETGLDPETLMIEITERAVMDNADFALGKLKRLKGLGVSFAIDDYGTGYSCLRYLKLMPLDFLKIDGVFIAGLGKDSGDTAIVHGTIDLAHALGLKVIAEGVETADQYERLRNLGCDMVQGFHFSRPLSASEASYLLEKNPPRIVE